ncbi:mannose-1-phosphate guanylyltransferase [Patescibacteria group bacterium]
MRAVIFAGGAGTRLWPLSRQSSPKQFDTMFKGKSTLQLAIDRIRPIMDWQDIYISTAKQYVPIVHQQLPDILADNIINEPDRRDLAPAVGLAMTRLRDVGNDPVAILWADHLMDRRQSFQNGLRVARDLIVDDPNRFIFFGEKSRYAEQNLGWINVDRVLDRIKGIPIRAFRGWHYRPPLARCKRMHASPKWVWNPGYWVTTPNFVLVQYKEKKPRMYEKLQGIGKALGTSREGKVLNRIYPTMENVSFDDAILEKMEDDKAVVLQLDMGWSDPGTLYAIKEALQKHRHSNVTRGHVITRQTEDSLIFNDDPKKVVAAVGLRGVIVVETKDAVLVVHKDHVPEVKKMVKSLKNTKWKKVL